MSDLQEKIARLEDRLDRLVRTQIDFQQEVSAIRAELKDLRGAAPAISEPEKPRGAHSWQKGPSEEKSPPPSVTSPAEEKTREVPPPSFGMPREPRRQHAGPERETGFANRYVSEQTASARTNLEKFIGENLISKIGIIVLIIGVGIGVK